MKKKLFQQLLMVFVWHQQTRSGGEGGGDENGHCIGKFLYSYFCSHIPQKILFFEKDAELSGTNPGQTVLRGKRSILTIG